MIAHTLTNREIMLFSVLLILIGSFISASSAVENSTGNNSTGNITYTIYEEYCFSSLVYLLGNDVAAKLEVSNLAEFLNKSEISHFYDTPLQTLRFSNQVIEKTVKVHIFRDVIESSENIDMLFYYTDAYNEDYEFFGCAITSNNLPSKKIIYDTRNAVYSISWRDPDSSMGVRLFSRAPVVHDIRLNAENVVINDLVFTLFERYVNMSSADLSVNWQGNLTLLVPYVEELPGKRAWEDYVEFRNADSLTPEEKEMLQSIKKNKTTYIGMPALEPIEPTEEERDVNYLLMSQTFIAAMVMIIIVYLIMKIKKENRSWGGEDD